MVVQPGQQVKLGPATTAYCFPADHISGAVGWRVDTGGMGVVFSGDTRFNPELVKASEGVRLLIHEAFRTDEDSIYAGNHGHSTGGDAGRAAAQAGVTELVLTHIDSDFDANPQPLLDAHIRRDLNYDRTGAAVAQIVERSAHDIGDLVGLNDDLTIFGDSLKCTHG